MDYIWYTYFPLVACIRLAKNKYTGKSELEEWKEMMESELKGESREYFIDHFYYSHVWHLVRAGLIEHQMVSHLDYNSTISDTDHNSYLKTSNEVESQSSDYIETSAEPIPIVKYNNQDCLGDVDLDSFFPKLRIVDYMYFILSPLLDLIFIIVNVVVGLLGNPKINNSGPYQCYIAKFKLLMTKDDSINHLSGTVICIISLIGRLQMWLDIHKLELDVAIFLVASEEQVSENLDTGKAYERFKSTGRLNAIQRVLLMRHETYDHKVVFLLRPNRTLETRKSLLRLVRSAEYFGVIGGSQISTIPAILFNSILLFDDSYTNCPMIERTGITAYLRMFVNALYTLFVALESQNMYTSIGSLTIITYRDALSCVEEIESRLANVDNAIETMRSFSQRLIEESDDDYRRLSLYETIRKNRDLKNGWKNYADSYGKFCGNLNSKSRSKLASAREEVSLFISLTVDFLEYVGRLDRLMSRFLLTFFMGWLCLYMSMLIYELSKDTLASWTIFKYMQLSSVPVMFVFAHYCGIMTNRTTRLYKNICDFMARDPSEDKVKWLSIMKFYTEKPRYSFTIGGIQIMSNMAIFRYASFVFSLISIIAVLQGNDD